MHKIKLLSIDCMRATNQWCIKVIMYESLTINKIQDVHKNHCSKQSWFARHETRWKFTTHMNIFIYLSHKNCKVNTNNIIWMNYFNNTNDTYKCFKGHFLGLFTLAGCLQHFLQALSDAITDTNNCAVFNIIITIFLQITGKIMIKFDSNKKLPEIDCNSVIVAKFSGLSKYRLYNT